MAGFCGAWKELADFVFPHRYFWKPNPIFWFSLVMNSQEKRTFRWFGLFWSPVNKFLIASYWTFSVACFVRFRTERSSMLIFISVAGLTLPFGWPFQVLFATRFIFSQNDIAKFHLARWPKWRVSKNHIVRERTSGSWMPNWFSSKMRSVSSLARATVAFGLFPLPCFLSSRRLDLRTSIEFLNSSSLRMLSLHCYHPSSAGYCARKRTLY